MSEQMQAGVELDELIATRVMGWKKGVDFDYVDHLESVVRYIPSTKDVLVFDPSTEWNAMRLVVEEMQRRGWKMVLLMKDEEYGCGFSKGEHKSAVDSTSAPYAVSVAALKALEADTHE